MKREFTLVGMIGIAKSNGRVRNNGYSVCLRKIDTFDFVGGTQ